MTIKRIKILILSIVILIISISVIADISPMPKKSFGIFPIDSIPVKMKTEKVNIIIDKNFSITSCTFNMFNFGKELTTGVGYPLIYKDGWDPKGNIRYLLEQEIKLDNKKLNFSDIIINEDLIDYINCDLCNEILINDTIDKEILLQMFDNNLSDYDRFRNQCSNDFQCDTVNYFNWILASEKEEVMYWFYWEYFFNREEKIIEINYKQNLTFRHWFRKVYYKKHSISRLFAELFYDLEIEDDGKIFRKKDQNFKQYEYYLHTGAGWYSDIDTAIVEVELVGRELDELYKIEPPFYNIDSVNKKIYWKFIDLEPTWEDNIKIVFIAD